MTAAALRTAALIGPLILCGGLCRAAERIAPFSPDLALVDPWSYELGSKQPFQGSYYAHFARGEKHLYYAASRHSTEWASPTLRNVRALFDKVRFDAALIEGTRAELGTNPAGRLAEYRADEKASTDKGFYKGSEPGLTAILASKRGIAFRGAEPSDREIHSQLFSNGYLLEDVLCFYTLRQIPQLQRERAFESKSFEQVYPELMSRWSKRYEVTSEQLPSLARLNAWHREKTGAAFDLSTYTKDSEAVAPLAGGTYVQRLSAEIGMIRDRFIVREIARALNDYDTVLVVFGHSHLATQRRALEAMMGPPVEQSDVAR
ncbi:MAG: hypothetical protein HY078_01190 [Elusimicrobia bacterium]|nr:hypothetical protein [Elusimicrobiota bacterium]